MSDGPSRQMRFTLLEAGRGVAALMVVLHHAGNMAAEPRFYGTHVWAGLLREFNVGVDFFFVLSGFIIAWVHWGDLGHADRLGGYAVKRFMRVYPPYWTVLFSLIVLYQLLPGYGAAYQRDAWHIGLSVLLLPDIVQPTLGVAWTLTHEIFFYALFAIAIVVGRGMLVAFALWAAAIVAANLLVSLPFPLSFVLSPFNLEFVMGVGAAAYLRRHHVAHPGVWLALGALAFAALLILGAGLQDVPLRARLLYGAVTTAMLVGAVEWERQQAIILPAPLLLLGAASYVIYLVHTPVLALAWPLAFRLPVVAPAWVLVLFLSGMAVAAGVIFHLVIERPLMRQSRRIASAAGHPVPRAAAGRP